MVPELEDARAVRVGDAGADREAAAEALGDRHDVGSNAELLDVPRASRCCPIPHWISSKTSSAPWASQASRAACRTSADRPGGCPTRPGSARSARPRCGDRPRPSSAVGVTARDDLEAGHERRERRLLRLLRRGRERAHRATVEGALEHDEVAAGTALARELERALDRLGAGVREEDPSAERRVGRDAWRAASTAPCRRGSRRASGGRPARAPPRRPPGGSGPAARR